jgi:hypothetical protein
MTTRRREFVQDRDSQLHELFFLSASRVSLGQIKQQVTGPLRERLDYGNGNLVI